VLQFVCECDVVKDTGKEEYLRPFIHIGLDWIGNRHSKSQLILNNGAHKTVKKHNNNE